ncbi:MAG: hypothetical protein U5M50_10565 [Sphingobium sp.]|nr:hypothetical protein [Sphingobium sp.]
MSTNDIYSAMRPEVAGITLRYGQRFNDIVHQAMAEHAVLPGANHNEALSLASQLAAVAAAQFVYRVRQQYPDATIEALWEQAMVDLQIRAQRLVAQMIEQTAARGGLQ